MDPVRPLEAAWAACLRQGYGRQAGRVRRPGGLNLPFRRPSERGAVRVNTTGNAAEKLDWHWPAFEKDRTYLAASVFRFVDELSAEGLAALWNRLHSDNLPVEVNRQQQELVLREAPVPCPKTPQQACTAAFPGAIFLHAAR